MDRSYLTLLSEAIIFASLIAFCVNYIWPKLLDAIEQRQKFIESGYDASERAHALEKECKAKAIVEIKAGRKEAAEIIERAEQLASEMIDKAKTEALSIIKEQKATAEKDIAAAFAHAASELGKSAQDLSIVGAEKILQRKINPSDHQVVLDEISQKMAEINYARQEFRA